MDTQEFSRSLEIERGHPHACFDGYVFIGYTEVDEETGEELELIERLPCRRCAEEGN